MANHLNKRPSFLKRSRKSFPCRCIGTRLPLNTAILISLASALSGEMVANTVSRLPLSFFTASNLAVGWSKMIPILLTICSTNVNKQLMISRSCWRTRLGDTVGHMRLSLGEGREWGLDRWGLGPLETNWSCPVLRIVWILTLRASLGPSLQRGSDSVCATNCRTQPKTVKNSYKWRMNIFIYNKL